MDVEEITLYGGPRHGDKLPIPANDEQSLTLECFMTRHSDQVRGSRTGLYTRVHLVSGHPSHDFEWCGYSTPFVPMGIGSSES